MSIWRLILTNLRQHRVRTLIGATGIALGAATMLSVVGLLGGAVRMFERILQSDAELIVFERDVSDLFFSNVPEESIEELRAVPAVAMVEPVLFALIRAPDRPVVTCFGVTAESSRLERAEWVAGSLDGFRDDGEGVVIGARAAEFLGAEVGRELTLGRLAYPVVGVIETENGFEDGGVFMPLAACQRAFRKEGYVSAMTVSLAEGAEVREVERWIGENRPELVALENDDFSRSYSQFRILKTTAWVVGGCAFLLGGLSVTNTMVLSVFGRIRELAVLRVCGFSRSQLAQLIFGESLVVAAIGVLVGVGLCFGALHSLKALPMLQGYIDPRIGWLEASGAGLLAALTAVVGAMYPAWVAVRLKPASALRYE